ncbi:hypothetical protein PLICRDRAFT_170455 [Plicaturopsis crispa FD-325 SS-3]|nr:hypothetical protein PLICRDRAFT_170455 [Plicaturopsis crispa FD-325 SS-3]
MDAKLVPQEYVYLRTLLDRYRETASENKKEIRSEAVEHICKTMRQNVTKEERRRLKNIVIHWFTDNGRIRFRNAKSLFGWRPWKLRKVVAFQKREEINRRLGVLEDEWVDEEENDEEDEQAEVEAEVEEGLSRGRKKRKGKGKSASGNTKQNIGDRQKVISEIINGMTKAEKQDLDKAVKDWNGQKPPAAVQAKAAREYRDHWIREVCLLFHQLLDTELLIVSANRDEDGDIDIRLHDWYKEAVQEHDPHAKGFTDMFPDADEKFLDKFKKWAAIRFEHPDGGDWSGDDEGQAKKKKKGPIEFDLDLDVDGYPILPDPLPTTGNAMKSLMREYMTPCWNIACGNPGGTKGVSWLKLANNLSDLVDPTKGYLPKNAMDGDRQRKFAICEPSKMTVADLDALLNHWKAREEKGVRPFKFRIQERRGTKKHRDMAEELSDEEPPKKRGPGRRRPPTPDEETFDLNEAEDNEEEDGNEEEADGRDGEPAKAAAATKERAEVVKKATAAGGKVATRKGAGDKQNNGNGEATKTAPNNLGRGKNGSTFGPARWDEGQGKTSSDEEESRGVGRREERY